MFSLGTGQAQITEFDIFGPQGPDLQGINEVPPNDSTAYGREVPLNEVGIHFDETSNELVLHYGWGDHAEVQGQDLSANFVKTGVYGPAAAGETNIIVEYFPGSPGYLDALSPTGRRGFVDDGHPLTTEQAEQLFNGELFINVYSSNPDYPQGEIRGNLVPVPEPATYTLMAALGLAGFAGVRYWRALRAG